MKNVLVLCTGNSCRSQIAHGYLAHFTTDKNVNIYSAGLEIHGVNPKAIQVMKEDGIDISHHTSNNVSEYSHVPFDLILTVCDHAHEHCPYFPSQAKRVHHNFPDPAKAKGPEEDVLQEFRKVRDLIKAYCFSFSKELC